MEMILAIVDGELVLFAIQLEFPLAMRLP